MKKQRVKLNVTLLSFCQALAITGNIIVFSVSALAGSELAPAKSMATVPLFLQYVSAMLTTLPASFIIKKAGTKNRFYYRIPGSQFWRNDRFFRFELGKFFIVLCWFLLARGTDRVYALLPFCRC